MRYFCIKNLIFKFIFLFTVIFIFIGCSDKNTFFINNEWEDHPDLANYTFNLLDSDFVLKPVKDMAQYCEHYYQFNYVNSKLFWTHFIALISKFESGHNPKATYIENFLDKNGERTVSRGLLQLSSESGNYYGCDVTDAELHSSQKNINCGLKIMHKWVAEDKLIQTKVNNKWKGLARYWAVLRKQETLEKIKKSSQEYCDYLHIFRN